MFDYYYYQEYITLVIIANDNLFVYSNTLPGSGKLGDNVCYASTTFTHEVRPTLNLTGPSIETQATEWNVAYDSVKASVTIRNENACLYETIDETRVGRRDASNNHQQRPRATD